MFRKQEYINEYIRDNYKTIKLRIRKDDDKVINRLNKVENINKYIYDLIINDINLNKTFNFINNEITIDFELSKPMERLIKEAEDADLNNDYGMYMNIAYAIDARAKNEVSRHILKNGQWNKLVRRYCV